MKLEINLSPEEMMDIVTAHITKEFPMFASDQFHINVSPGSYAGSSWRVNIDPADPVTSDIPY